MAVNWKGSLAWKVGCRRDVFCIGVAHKDGNECDERVMHNERTVQIHELTERILYWFSEGRSERGASKAVSTSEFEGTKL